MQWRLPETLLADLTAYADRMGITVNAAASVVLSTGIAALAAPTTDTERSPF